MLAKLDDLLGYTFRFFIIDKKEVGSFAVVDLWIFAFVDPMECDLSRVNLSFSPKSETRIRERLNTQCIYGAAAWKNVSSGPLLSCC